MNINGIFDHRVHSIHSILRCFHPTSTNFSEYKKKLMSLKSSFWCDHSQGWIGLMRVWEFLCISNNSTVHTHCYLHTLWGKKKFLLHGKHVMILNPRGQIQTYSIYCSDLIWSGLELTGAKPDVCESVCVCVCDTEMTLCGGWGSKCRDQTFDFPFSASVLLSTSISSYVSPYFLSLSPPLGLRPSFFFLFTACVHMLRDLTISLF